MRSPCTTAREEPTRQKRPGPARKKERSSLRGTQGGEKGEALWVRSSALWETGRTGLQSVRCFQEESL